MCNCLRGYFIKEFSNFVWLFLLTDAFVCRAQNAGAIPEMVIIELQGDLETKSQSASLSGKFVGDLHFNKSVSVALHELQDHTLTVLYLLVQIQLKAENLVWLCFTNVQF